MNHFPERSEEDRMNEERAIATAELIRAGGEFRGGIVMIPGTVRNRIQNIGDLAHAQVVVTDAQEIEKALIQKISVIFRDKEYPQVTTADGEKLIEIVRSLGAASVDKIRRRLPKWPENRIGFLDYSTWKEFVRYAVPVIEEGIRYRKVEAAEIFASNKYLHDKRFD